MELVFTEVEEVQEVEQLLPPQVGLVVQGAAGGIAEAILTTAAGLFIAIPALVFYNYFTAKAESLVLEIEKHSNALLKKLRGFRTQTDISGHQGEVS